MGKERLTESIFKLIEFWDRQGISSKGFGESQIDEMEKSLGLKLPDDFRYFYKHVNGMEQLYPNYVDVYGFLFYPFKNLEIVNLKKSSFAYELGSPCVVFANYLHRSWSYGVVVDNTIASTYSILIIGSPYDYRMVSNDLQDFLEKYMVDDAELYWKGS